jgi:oligoendopeptidase F
MKPMRFPIIGVPALLLALLPGIAGAQDAAAPPFQPIPPAETQAYRFNLQKFYADDAAYDAALKEMDRTVTELETLKGKVIASPRNLLRTFQLTDAFNSQFSKLYWYLQLQYSTDTKNTGPRDASTELDAKYSPRLAFVNDEVQNLTAEQLDKFIRDEPGLAVYRYAVDEARRARPHTLSLKEEELLAKTYPLMTQWQEDAYDLLMDRAEWGKVTDPETGKVLDVRQDGGQLNNSVTRSVRKEAYDKSNAAYKDQRDLFAFDFLNVAKTNNKLAQIRDFQNGQAAAYFGRHLTYDEVTNAYEQVLGHGDLRKRFQILQRQRIASFTGYDDVKLYDMSVVPPGVEKPRFTIDQARRIILDSVAYLGPEYTRDMADLLDPANGRLDIVSGPDRVANAFAIPSPGFPSVFYSYGYEGYFEDVSTLAHEGGHVVNSALQNSAGVVAANSDGPRYFTESYAILNEIVLADKLYREETDPGRKVFYLEQLLQQMMGFYGTTRIAAIEKAVYEGVDKGGIKTADDLDKITEDIGRKVSIWHELDPTTNMLWEQIPHYYSSPTYYSNYVFADLLAQTYFAQYKKDPADFGKRFVALLQNGFNDTPQNLLKKFMKIDLTNPKTFDALFEQQKTYLGDLERLYRQVPVTNK